MAKRNFGRSLGLKGLRKLVQSEVVQELYRLSWTDQAGEYCELELSELPDVLEKAGGLLRQAVRDLDLEHVWVVDGGAGEIAERMDLLHPAL